MSKPIALHLILARLRRMTLPHQIELLRWYVASEAPYSVRRNELISILQGKLTKQLKRENLVHRTTDPASASSGQAAAERASA